ncbi:hypothetical protein ACFXP7_05455 [Microbacterium sp. P06]|uniref:hypothetical protein n=1 Tax=Microbacterium sp. P06 TaxID=3366949 RepID=UPI003745BFF3
MPAPPWAMQAILDAHPARGGVRHQRSTVVKHTDGFELVSIRLQPVDGRHLFTYLHFPTVALLHAEVSMMEASVALAARQMNPAAIPTIAEPPAAKPAARFDGIDAELDSWTSTSAAIHSATAGA